MNKLVLCLLLAGCAASPDFHTDPLGPFYANGYKQSAPGHVEQVRGPVKVSAWRMSGEWVAVIDRFDFRDTVIYGKTQQDIIEKVQAYHRTGR